MKTKILAFAGSTRKDSWNKQLVKIAAEGAKQAGCDVTYIDLAAYALPLYDGDLESEEGLPETAMVLKKIFKSHQGFLIASPEYNSSISGVLKNTIDWVSRPVDGEPNLAAFKGKVVSLMSASPGSLGGLRGLTHVRSILSSIGSIVLPNQVAISKAYEAFADGGLVDKTQHDKVVCLGHELGVFVKQLSPEIP